MKIYMDRFCMAAEEFYWIKSSKTKPVVLDFPEGYPFDMSSRKDPTHIRVYGRKNKFLFQ